MTRFTLPLLLLLPPVAPAADLSWLKVPADFAVTEFADAKLANDIYCMTIDAKGRVLVAGTGYVRHLIDADGDGKADRAVDVIPPPKQGPMGLLWEGETLYVVTDGGLWRYTGVNGVTTATGKPELLVKLTTGGEHAAHAVRRLPDGKLYVLCGNNTGITAQTVTDPDSPIKNPVAGCLLRVSDDGKAVAVIADGFRNAYDFDFDLSGIPVTFDSDNERCVGLPWTEPTRLYQISLGDNHGWMNPQFASKWRKPPYFPDVNRPTLTAGRGSPTGVACYRHTAFGNTYRGGTFFADWTFGTVWFSPLARRPNDPPQPFLTVSGDNGFAPTGLAVEPKSGDLFVSIGGRGTRGAVYRVHSTKAQPNAQPITVARTFWRPRVAFPVPERIRPLEFGEAKTPAEQLRVLRGWQLTLGDLCDPKRTGTAFEGYSMRKPVDANTAREVCKAVRHPYPTGNAEVDRELSRTLAALEDSSDEATGKVFKHLRAEVNPVEKVHDLIVLARLGGKLPDADAALMANELVTLDSVYEAAKIGRDTNWPPVMTDVVAALLKKRPALAEEIVGHPRFGRPDHAWLAAVPGMDKAKAARAFVAQSAGGGKYEWNAGTVKLLAALPPAEAKPVLVRLFDAGGLEDAVLPLLARSPDEADRATLVRGLSSLQASVVTAAAGALSKLPAADTAELVPLVQALRRFADPKTDATVRAAVLKRLTDTTKQTLSDASAWEKWLSDTHPELAKKLVSPGYDAVKWKAKLAEVKWDAGNAERGVKLFATANCAACHVGGRATGPSLVGVAKRFSRDDLLTTILDPNRDVSPRYRTTRVTTDEDKVYEGVVIYDAPDGLLLQTSADVTVRIAGKSITSRRPGTNSLMPAGLLDAFKPEEIADLMAYLKGL